MSKYFLLLLFHSWTTKLGVHYNFVVDQVYTIPMTFVSRLENKISRIFVDPSVTFFFFYTNSLEKCCRKNSNSNTISVTYNVQRDRVHRNWQIGYVSSVTISRNLAQVDDRWWVLFEKETEAWVNEVSNLHAVSRENVHINLMNVLMCLLKSTCKWVSPLAFCRPDTLQIDWHFYLRCKHCPRDDIIWHHIHKHQYAINHLL